MTVAAKTALGRYSNRAVKNKVVIAIMIAVMTLANGVFAPASKFTTERLNPSVTGNPPPKPLAIFAAPIRSTPSSAGFFRGDGRRVCGQR